MSEVCAEFSQNAWRKDLCANCLRPRSEHIKPPCNHLKPRRNSAGRGSPPVPAKRNSSLIKGNLSIGPRVSPIVDKNANDQQNLNENIKLLSIKPLVVEDNVSKRVATHSSDENPLSCEQSGSKDNSINSKVDLTKSENLPKGALKLTRNKDENRTFRVIFSDSEPEIIGHDGGADYLYSDDDDDVPEEAENTPPESIQLTEEEKQFALLALENTLWNSDIHNLRVETPLEGRLKRVPSKEFEDVELEFLWKADRFQGLRDCDLLPKKFGTFPRRNKSPKAHLPSRPSLEFSQAIKTSPLKSSKNLDNENLQEADDDLTFRLRSASENSTLYQSRNMQSNASKNMMNQNMSKDTDNIQQVSSSPYRVVETLPKPAPKPASLKKGVSDPVEKPIPSVRHKDDRQLSQTVMSMMSRSVEGRLEDCFEKTDIGDSDTLRRQGLKPPAPVKRQHLTKEGTIGRRDEMSSSFAGTTFDRKFDRDDFTMVRVDGDAYEARYSKAKSVDFEAKMASVAATLDFTKTKGKRQAPQPPVSPVAGVSASPSKSSTKSSDGSCKKGPSLDQCRRSAVGEDVESMESMDCYKGKNNENRMKKGFASMFRSFLRRGRESSSESSTEQSFDNSTAAKPNDISKEIPSIIYDSKSEFLSPDNGNLDDTSGGQFRVRVFPSPTKSNVSVSSTTSSTSNETLDSRPPSEIISSSDVRNEPQDRPRESTEELDESNPSSRKSTLSRDSVHQLNSMSNSSNLSENTEDVVVVKRRVKSPKKMPAPSAPRCTATTEKNALFAKELELRLSKAVENKTGTLKKTPAPQPPVPPPPLVEGDANTTEAPAAFVAAPSSESSRQERQEAAVTDVRPIEKIELPKAAQSRRSFLGKLAGNRRSRPPPPPVKRAKSITEASLPLHDMHMKKIDLSDISGPVDARVQKSQRMRHLHHMQINAVAADFNNRRKVPTYSYKDTLLAEMSPSGTVSRRNTVTLGDDSAFGSGGSTSSGSGGDKNFEDPNISPLGSVENLYEPITPKYPGQRDNYYYPVDPSRSNSASRTSSNGSSNFPTEGYLEPIISMRPPSVVTTAPIITAAVVAVGTAPPAAAATFSSTVPSDTVKLPTMHTVEPVRTSLTESSAESSPQLSAELPPSQIQESLQAEIPEEEERQIILASQPIYEEINGYSKNNADEEGPPPLPKDNRIPRSTVGEAKTPIQSHSSDNLLEHCTPTPPQPPLAPLPQPTIATLTRPKPAPRRKPKRPHGAPPEQYVAMNRPATVTISLGADDVKEMYSKLTNMNQDTLQHIHNYFESIFSRGLDRTLGFLKWSDFELISKQPVHTSEDCIVYCAKLLQDKAFCHLVLTHGNNVCDSYVPHPAFMRLQNLSANDIPASFLPSMTDNTDNQCSVFPIGSSSSSTAVIPSPHWHLAVGQYSSMVTWHDYITDLKDTMLHNPDSFVQILSFLFLQVVSGILHHLDRGSPQLHFRPVRIFLLSQKNFSGKRVCLLPSFKADNKLPSDMNDFCAKLLHNLFDKYLFDDEKLLECSKGLYRGLELLQSDKPDCLAIVRGMLELVIWGPYPSELAGSTFTSQEQAYDFWLDKERAMMVNRFARCSLDPSGSFSIEDFYKLRFLLNSTGTTLVENSQYIS